MKAWGYISAVLLGALLGVIGAVKWLADKTVFTGRVKIKQRGRGNTQAPTFETVIEDRKLDRLRRRIERRKERALRKLDS